LDKSDWLRDAVVNACADDYEDIVRINADVKDFAQQDGVRVSEEEVVTGIEIALAAGLIKCYELSGREPFRREAELDKSRLVEFGQYFYVTAKGKEFLLAEDTKEL
jgi:hypothetical protein